MNKAQATQFMTTFYRDVMSRFALDQLDNYLTVDYTQTTNGHQFNTDQVKQHLANLHANLDRLVFSYFNDVVFDETTQTITVAYQLTATQHNGHQALAEVISIFTFADNKLARCHELIIPLMQDDRSFIDLATRITTK
ncbi:nuclear transport factor 2 family protein [Loigolactobacillus jiayinensis]|mgnify:CR=1 FL=1|uniref:Nuclear transport factor 2 family protein n=1 Tax=Loigolactobacillus jiayinensis TaxID=2486016 RepID=A0ABW1RCK4_9LACO|nr:nuclear transport factor 2 family protein [Loigolactobacillus jiayinensis]